MIIFISANDEPLALRTAHKAACNRSAAYKINAAIFFGTPWELKAAKEARLRDDDTLRSHILKYKNKGVEGLFDTHYKGLSCRLSNKREPLLHNELENNIYLTSQKAIHCTSLRDGGFESFC